MEPRSDERGNLHAAAPLALYKMASMEPRSDERGNALSRIRSSTSNTSLQWSHAQMSVETASFGRACWQEVQASMEPRSDERGNATLLYRPVALAMASMEPRSDERGNLEGDDGRDAEITASMEPRSDERG